MEERKLAKKNNARLLEESGVMNLHGLWGGFYKSLGILWVFRNREKGGSDPFWGVG